MSRASDIPSYRQLPDSTALSALSSYALLMSVVTDRIRKFSNVDESHTEFTSVTQVEHTDKLYNEVRDLRKYLDSYGDALCAVLEKQMAAERWAKLKKGAKRS